MWNCVLSVQLRVISQLDKTQDRQIISTHQNVLSRYLLSTRYISAALLCMCRVGVSGVKNIIYVEIVRN